MGPGLVTVVIGKKESTEPVPAIIWILNVIQRLGPRSGAVLGARKAWNS